MKMRYIIFTAVLMCLFGEQVWGQLSVQSSGVHPSNSSSVSCTYGECLTVTIDNGVPNTGTIYIAPDNVNRTNPGLTKYENGNPLMKIEIESGSAKNVPISLPVTQGTKYWVWYTYKKTSIQRTSVLSISFSVAPRPIKINASQYYNDYSKKTYDGGTDVDDNFKINFKPYTYTYYSTDDTKSGILDTDVNDVSFDITSAAYKNKNCAGEKQSEIEVEFQNTGLTGSKAGNYQLVFDDPNNKKLTFPGTIEQKPLTLDLNFTKVYDGTTAATLGNRKFTHTDNNSIIENEEIEISSATGSFESPNASADVQTVNDIQVVYATNDGHSNYAITFNGSGTITKQSLNLVLGEKFVYETSKIGTDIIFQKPKNAQNQEVDGKFELYKDNNRVNYNVGDNLGVGNYRVVFVPTNATNYNNAEKEFEVETKKLSLIIQFEKTYDGNNILSNNIKSYSFPNKSLNDDVQISSLSATVGNVNVGNHNITISSVILSNTNYVVDNDEITSTGTIKPKVLTFNNLQFEKTYDGGVDASSCYRENYSFNEELCSQNGVKDVVPIRSLTATFDDKNASTGFTKKVSVSNVVLSNFNYEVKNFEKENSGKINKRILTPSFAFQKVYDGNDVATNSLTSEFANKKLTHDNCTDVVAGEEVEFSFTSAAFATASKHEDRLVTIEGLQLSNSNYELNGYGWTPGKITPQPITIFPLNGSPFPYGTSIFGTDINPTVSETNPTIRGTFTAHLKNSTATYKMEELPMLLAGDYTISYKPNDEQNYQVTNNNEIEFTVVKKKIDVVLTFEKPYDGDNVIKSYPAEKLTNGLVNGILAGDEVDFILKGGSVFESANVHEKENCNKINIELLANNKYELNSFSATSKITAKELNNVEFRFEKNYDGSDDASECLKTDNPLKGNTIAGIIGNDEVPYFFTNLKFQSASANETTLQNMQYDALISGNDNYTFVNPIVKGKIYKKGLVISVAQSSVTYGDSKLLTNIAPSINPNENPVGTKIPGTFVAVNKTTNEKYSGDVMLPVGEYEVTFELPDNEKDNYNVQENKTVIVEPKFIENIKLSYVENKIYDATTNVLGFNKVITGLLEGDEITITAKYNDKKADDPNTVIEFTISPSESVIQNYSCAGTPILNANQDVLLTTLTDWNSADFSIPGKIEKCKINLTYTLTADKEYDATNVVNDFSVTKVTAKSNNGDIDLSELEGEIYSGETIKITPQAEYNSKNVKDAKTITISGSVDNVNYEVVGDTKEESMTQRKVIVSQLNLFSKTYDGTKVIENFSGSYYNVTGIYNNEVQFNFDKAEYESENAGTNVKINLVNSRLENNIDENYTLTVNDFTGEIKKIKPTIRWFVYDRLIEGKSTEMGYGNKMGSSEDNKEEEYYLKAAIYEVPYKDKYLPAVYSYKDKGEENYTQINLPTILHPGELVGKVQFVSKDDNYATVSSEIDVAVLLNTTIEHKVTTTVYGFAEIGKESIYFYSSYYGFFKFTYYLDGQEVPEGYKPKVGKHTLYCKVEDKNGYLPEKQTETIEFTIVPRELNVSEFTWTKDKDGSELRRHYDGTNNVYENQIIEYPQLDKYMIVDGDDVELSIEMSYSSEEVGDRDVNIKYSLKGDDSYCYVFAENVAPEYAKPGEITKCPAVVGFKELDKVYGNSELGKDITATYTYVKFKGEQISVPGHYTYEIRINDNERAEHYPGEMLDVGVYNIRVLFTPEDNEHYETGFSHAEYVKVTPKAISATGVTIADKYYDGTKKVDPNKVKLFEPELDGIIEKDKNNVKLEITNLDKIVYPDFKIGDYQGIVVKVNLAGSGIGNYELKNHELKAASSILPFEFFYNMEPDETGVYQLVYGTSVMGEDFKLINELTETQIVRYVIMDIDKTNQMLVPNTYQVDVQLYDAGTLVLSKTVTVNVVKLKLLTTAPEIAHRKLYDGSVSVRQTGEKCVLTNVVGSDKVRIDEQIQQYDDPNIGSNKTITVTFSLTGPWQSKYIEPDGYVYTDGVITNKDIKVSFLGVGADVCPSSSVPFEFCIDEGLPEKGSITFSDDALNAGFENITLSNSQTAMGINSIEVNIPEKVKAGKYQATLHLESGDGNKLDTLFDFTVNYAASYIISKFTDVVAINNAGYDFVGYQWYKDGHVVENENKQFFNDLPCLYGWYSAKVLTVDGTYANICPRYFDKRTAVSKRANAAGVNVYPNPALPMQAVTVELKDFEDYENCTILIYNLSGVLITKIQNPDRLNTLNLPQGSYTGVVVKDDSRLNFKLIVRK